MAATADTVEETARRAAHLAEVRDGLAEDRAGADRALLLRTIEVASGLDGAGHHLAALIEGSLPAIGSILSDTGMAEPNAVYELAEALAASVEVDDAVAAAKSGKITQLDVWMSELGDLIAAEDEALAEALSSSRRVGPFPQDVERWRRVVTIHFPANRVNEALLVIACESGGDPEARNRRTGAAGLFQFLSGTWRFAAQHAGFDEASRQDAVASIAAAAWLVRDSESSGVGPWAHWSCRP